MTTANKITIVRIAMIPAFVLMAIYYGQSIQRGAPEEWQRFTAIVIFLVAAVSVLVITRDVVILVGSAVLHILNGKVRVRPSWTGKVATVLQMSAIAWVMLQLTFLPLTYVVIAAGLFTFISGCVYVADGVRQIEGHANARIG